MWHILITSLPMLITLFWFIFYLLEWKTSQQPKKILTYFFGVTTLLYFCHFLYFNQASNRWIEVAYSIANLSVYPLFYMYIQKLTSPHSTPVFIYLLPAILVGTANTLIFCFNNNPAEALSLMHLISKVLFALQVLVVLVCGLKSINLFDKQIDEYYSNDNGKAIRLTKGLLILFAATSFASATLNFIGRFFFTESTWIAIPAILMSILLFSLGYVASKHTFTYQLFQQEMQKDEMLQNDDEQQKDEETDQVLSEEIALKLQKQLEQLMEMEKPYLTPNLKITDISTRMGTNRTYISLIINQQLHTNFSTYINGYRLKYAQKLLMQSEQLDKATVGDIIEQSGFSSNSSFYRIFKQATGFSPIDWRNKQL